MNESLLETVRALGCLQLDPTAVVARNHLLVLFSRHGAFDEAQFERLAYEERALFEYWAHEASYVLSEDLPIHRHLMRPPGGWRTRMAAWWESEHEFRAHILARLTAEGPLRAREIEDRAKVPWESSGWTNARNVARMLDLMWVRGEAGISRREGAQRIWDLMERCLPADAPDEELSDEEVTRRAAPRAIRALGAARIPHIRAHFTRNRYPHLQRVLETHDQLQRIEVEGLGDDWWIHVEDLETLDADFRGRTALLSPFDNLLCDRARTEQLFGFSHRLEIYTPKAKRRWGYFVLPVLDRDRLVARADLAIDRKTQHTRRARGSRGAECPAREAAAAGDPARARAARGVAGRDRARGARGAIRLAASLGRLAPDFHPRLMRRRGGLARAQTRGS